MTDKSRVIYIGSDHARADLPARPLLVDYSRLVVRRTALETLVGQAGYRPILMLAAALFFMAMVLLPVPQTLTGLMDEANPRGYGMLQAGADTIAESANRRKNPEAFQDWVERGRPDEEGLASSEEIGRLALIMIGILVVAILLWGTEALPIGGTAVLVAVLMYAFGILSVHEIPKAFMNDAVFFILGILAVAVGVRKTGLDRRIGLLLLSRIGSVGSFAFIFFPLMAIASGFLSEHALVALLVPVMMGVYKSTCAANGVKQDRVLAIFLLLGLCYAANVGGPGSPAGGARNAIMVGYFADAGLPIGFGEWMKFGLPLVPVLALTVGAYMYARCAPKLSATSMNPSEVVKQDFANLPAFRGKEAVMAAILALLVVAWMTLGDILGLGGAALAAVSAMFVFRIVGWHDIQGGVAFDVAALYAAASAMAVGLTITGAALWVSNAFIEVLPGFASEGNGLVIWVSIMTGTLTNFMSDGATVGALAPVVLPMADLGNVSVWKLGLITSFSSSFAMILVVGTPNNAIVFAMSKDPETGKRLLSVFDFIKYGLPLTLLLMPVMWGWALFGYWNFMSWP